MNTEERGRSVRIAAVGADALGALEVLSDPQPIALAPVSTRSFTVRVRAEPKAARGSQALEFVVTVSDDSGGSFAVHEKSRFLVP
jgi:hypothetical protein